MKKARNLFSEFDWTQKDKQQNQSQTNQTPARNRALDLPNTTQGK